MTIDLPERGASRYQVNVEADLRAVASTLPAPLTKAAGAAQRLKVNADGDMAGFTLSGSLATIAILPRTWRSPHAAWCWTV